MPVSPRRLRLKEPAGFTLVEVTIVVGIIALIAAISVPLYQTFAKRAKMTEGEILASELQRLEDRYFVDNLSYAPTVQLLAMQTSTIQYYKSINIQLNGVDVFTGQPVLYQIIVSGNVDTDPDLDAWVLTMDLGGNATVQHACIPASTGRLTQGCTD